MFPFMMYENTTRKVIVDEWTKLLYFTLEKLNEAMIRMHNGCVDLLEYLTIQDRDETLQRLRYENASFIITYMNNLLTNGQGLFTLEDLETITSKLEILKRLHGEGIKKDNEVIKVFVINKSDRTYKKIFKLTPYFEVLSDELDLIYQTIIKNLESILFLEGNLKNKVKK